MTDTDSNSMSSPAVMKSARRSLLYVPGDSLHKLEKSAGLDVDAIILDIEDGVAAGRKLTARETIRRALQEINFGGRERLVRVNPIDSGLTQAEIGATADVRPDGYVVPKVQNDQDLLAVDSMLTDAEHANHLPMNSLRLFAMIETAKGVLNLPAIAASTTRLDGLILGAEDLAADMGAVRTAAGWEIFYARSAIMTAAAAYGLQPIDSVFVDLHDLEALAEECQLARRLGFIGKAAIHPRQLDLIQRAFAPSPDEVAYAQRLMEAFTAHQTEGTGAFDFEGKMVDMPVVRAAQRILHRAQAIRVGAVHSTP